MSELRNKYSKEDCLKKLALEDFNRTTISFYKYVYLEDVSELRDELYIKWDELGVLGRIYLSQEGINAQLNVPEHNFDKFRECVDSYECFKDVPFKVAVEEREASFYKLNIKVKEFIVADGLNVGDYDVTNVGNHLNAEEFNKAMDKDGTIVVDMRNHYESEIGHFKGAVCPDSDTFREELPMVKEALKGKEDNKVLLYCTGGIRCEKASAYLKNEGFKDVNQLHGGIINYKHEIEEKGIESKFIGKNFVFDERRAEDITDDIISECAQCDKPCATHVNCKNDACHLLFIQCKECAEAYDGCCTNECKEFNSLPLDDQKRLRKKGVAGEDCLSVYKSRLRPNLKEIIAAEKAGIENN